MKSERNELDLPEEGLMSCEIMEQWKRGRIIVYASKDGEKGLRVVTEACGEETVDFYSLKQIREFIEHYEKTHSWQRSPSEGLPIFRISPSRNWYHP